MYGFDLSPEDRRLLRSPPPPEAIAWCERTARGRVVDVRALDGGLSSAVHAIDLADGRRLVLRRFVRDEWLAEEPDVPRREAAALAVARATRLPTPELVAQEGRLLLMTRLPGAVVWEPDEVEPYLRRLAEALPAIHATPLPPGHGLPDYAAFELEIDGPPAWSDRPRMWERALELFERTPPSHSAAGFLHRDYHPGNVLWTGGKISGVVDWPSASVGPPEADVGHCRMDLAQSLGLEAADRFAEQWRAITGADEPDPRWDLAAALGGFDGDELADWNEDFVAQAVARL